MNKIEKTIEIDRFKMIIFWPILLHSIPSQLLRIKEVVSGPVPISFSLAIDIFGVVAVLYEAITYLSDRKKLTNRTIFKHSNEELLKSLSLRINPQIYLKLLQLKKAQKYLRYSKILENIKNFDSEESFSKAKFMDQNIDNAQEKKVSIVPLYLREDVRAKNGQSNKIETIDVRRGNSFTQNIMQKTRHQNNTKWLFEIDEEMNQSVEKGLTGFSRFNNRKDIPQTIIKEEDELLENPDASLDDFLEGIGNDSSEIKIGNMEKEFSNKPSRNRNPDIEFEMRRVDSIYDAISKKSDSKTPSNSQILLLQSPNRLNSSASIRERNITFSRNLEMARKAEIRELNKVHARSKSMHPDLATNYSINIPDTPRANKHIPMTLFENSKVMESQRNAGVMMRSNKRSSSRLHGSGSMISSGGGPIKPKTPIRTTSIMPIIPQNTITKLVTLSNTPGVSQDSAALLSMFLPEISELESNPLFYHIKNRTCALEAFNFCYASHNLIELKVSEQYGSLNTPTEVYAFIYFSALLVVVGFAKIEFAGIMLLPTYLYFSFRLGATLSSLNLLLLAITILLRFFLNIDLIIFNVESKIQIEISVILIFLMIHLIDFIFQLKYQYLVLDRYSEIVREQEKTSGSLKKLELIS